MPDSSVVPAWAQTGIAFISGLSAVFAFILNRGNISGKTAQILKQNTERVEAAMQRQERNDTDIATQRVRIEVIEGRMNNLERKMDQANEGIATLVERSKHR